jgi:transposase
MFHDHTGASLFPRRGHPPEAPWRRALVTVLPCVEIFSDRQAADAVHTRIDWTSALLLLREDVGCDFSMLCAFRGRLLAGGGEQWLCEARREYAKAQGR